MISKHSFLLQCLCGFSLLLAAFPLQAQTAEERRERDASVRQGGALFEQGKYKEAAQTLERALELSIRLFGADDNRTLDTQRWLGMTYFLLNDHAKAEPHYLRGMFGQEKQHGKISPEVASCLCYLGFRFTEKGDKTAAEDYLVRGIKTWDAVPEAVRLRQDAVHSYPIALGALGVLFKHRGDFTKAEAVLVRARKIWDAGKAKEERNSLANLEELGDLYAVMGEYAKAEPLLKRALNGWQAQLGDSPELADALHQLAVMYMKMGQLPQAEPLIQRALKICEEKCGRDHPKTISALQGLGSLYRRLKKYDEAEACYARGLKSLEAKFGADGPELFFLLESAAVLAQYRDQYEKALAIRLRTLKMAEASFGPEHPHTALVLYHIGDDYRLLDDPAKAESYWTRALKAREAILGTDHPDTVQTLFSLAVLHASMGRWEQALASLDRGRRASRRYIARVLPGLSEAQQLTFLDTNHAASNGIYNALSVGVVRSTDPVAVTRSAEWLLNGKAITQQALAERSLQALASADPAQAKVLRQLNTVRGQLAGLSLTAPKPGQEAAHRKELERLTTEEQELAKRLGQAMGRPTRDDPWVGLDEVRQALPADAVLIEIAEFWVTQIKSVKEIKRGQAHFVAWVIPAAGKGEVKLVDLGPSGPIEQAVAAVRKSLKESPKSIRDNGEAEAEKELRKSLDPLAKLVLEPLLPHIGDTKHWILSPDTDLWLVPWAALPLKDGSYAAEKHTLSYVISGRDLATSPVKAPEKRDPPLVIADPDFDIEPKEAAALTAKLLGKPIQPDGGLAAILDAPQGLRSVSGVGRVARLPGTAAEATAIKPKLEAYAGETPWVYRGTNALEGVFKSFRSPKVVVLSTHGYFLDDDKNGKVPENPLLRCGLLLAGCNERLKASGGQQDGVLTGLEIVGSDLRGTELVVLSACETGLGDVRLGEGVSGLRQAFQLAGAQAVVASLWQVPDRDTAFLMSDFFDGLAKGKSKAEALREAQLARIKAHRDRDGAAHPFFWAAFTLTGR